MNKTMSELTPELKARFAQSRISEISQNAKAVSPLDWNADYPDTLSFEVEAKQYSVQEGDWFYLQLPAWNNPFAFKTRERNLPFMMSRPIRSETQYGVTLPENATLTLMPESFRWDAPNDGGSIEFTVEYTPENGQLMLTQKIDLRVAEYTPSQYLEIFEVGKRLAHPRRLLIMFKRP